MKPDIKSTMKHKRLQGDNSATRKIFIRSYCYLWYLTQAY